MSQHSISWQAWYVLLRIPTLSAAVVPVFVGTAYAAGRHPLQWTPFVLALGASLLIQTGTNFVNDLADFTKGADTGERLGPVRGLQTGEVTIRQLAWATYGVFGVALLIGLYLVLTHGWPILAIGVAAILSGIAYTAGPLPLAYVGLGDVFVFIFFGVLGVMGSAYLQMGSFSWGTFAASVPVGLLATAIIVVNNLRDIETDRRARKYTLAVLLGKQGVRMEFLLCLGVSYLTPWLLHQMRIITSPLWVLPWLTLPLTVPLVRRVLFVEGPALNRALKEMGRLHLLFGLLLAGSLL